MQIGQYIRRLRKSKGYSIEELSFRSGISAKTIQRLENGLTNPRGHTLQKISDVLEVSIEELTVIKPQDNFNDWPNEKELEALKRLNLSALLVVVFPLANIILPLFFFKKVKIFLW